MDQWIAGGRVRDALLGAGRAGRMPRFSPEQMVAVENALLKGALAMGTRLTSGPLSGLPR